MLSHGQLQLINRGLLVKQLFAEGDSQPSECTSLRRTTIYHSPTILRHSDSFIVVRAVHRRGSGDIHSSSDTLLPQRGGGGKEVAARRWQREGGSEIF